jgi:hypothetical protein
MSKQCPSCGGDCGHTKLSGCQYRAVEDVALIGRNAIDEIHRLADEHRQDLKLLALECNKQKQRAEAAERALATARNDALEEVIELCENEKNGNGSSYDLALSHAIHGIRNLKTPEGK